MSRETRSFNIIEWGNTSNKSPYKLNPGDSMLKLITFEHCFHRNDCRVVLTTTRSSNVGNIQFSNALAESEKVEFQISGIVSRGLTVSFTLELGIERIDRLAAKFVWFLCGRYLIGSDDGNWIGTAVKSWKVTEYRDSEDQPWKDVMCETVSECLQKL